jgi:nitrate/nitrite transporter NarK
LAEDGSGNMGLVVAGYILAVVVPLVGFILGIVAATRPQKRISKHGVWIVVVSIVVTALYLVVVLHSGRGTESKALRL